MFAEPGLVEAEAVECLDPLEVVLERQGGVLPHRVERCVEDAEAKRSLHVRGGLLCRVCFFFSSSVLQALAPSRASSSRSSARVGPSRGGIGYESGSAITAG